MELKELKLKSDTQLHDILSQKRAQLRDLRFQVSADQHKKVHEVAEVRKIIARILTLLNQKNRVADKKEPEENKKPAEKSN